MRYIKNIVFLFLLSFSFVSAFDINSILNIKENIVDQTNTLNEYQKNEINNKIENIRKKYTVEILLLIIPTTDWEDISKLATEIWQKVWVWKKDKDNWIVILISLHDRTWNISTWYWVEWVLPDLLVNKIWQKNFLLFKEKKYFEWISWTLDDIDKYLTWDKSVISSQNYILVNSLDNNKNIFIFEFIIVLLISWVYLKFLVREKKYKKAFKILFISYLVTIPIIYLLVWFIWIFINFFIWLAWWTIWIFWKNWTKWFWGNSWWWGGWWFGWWNFWWWWSSWKW